MTDSPASPIAFAVVPVAARHDGWTPARQARFIAELARIGLVAPAARAIGMSPKSAYALRARPGADSFAAAWDEAIVQGGANATRTGIARAIEGELRPVFYKGKQVGEVRRYNDRLLVAAMRWNRSRELRKGNEGNGT